MPPQLLPGEDHRQRLAGPLRVPDQARPVLCRDRVRYERHRAVDQLVHRLELLITGDLFGDFSLLSLEDHKVLKEVEQVCRLETQQPPDRYLQRVIWLRRLGLVPPAVVLRVEAEPTALGIEMLLDVVLAGVVE